MKTKLAAAAAIILIFLAWVQIPQAFASMQNSTGTYEDYLLCTSFDAAADHWVNFGPSPYLNSNDNSTSYVYTPAVGLQSGDYHFQNYQRPANSQNLRRAYLFLTCWTNTPNANLNVSIWEDYHNAWTNYTVALTSTSYFNYTVDIFSLYGILGQGVNSTKVRLTQADNTKNEYCTYAFLYVEMGYSCRRSVCYEWGDSLTPNTISSTTKEVDGWLSSGGTYHDESIMGGAYAYSGSYGVNFHVGVVGSAGGQYFGRMHQAVVDLVNATFLNIRVRFRLTGGNGPYAGDTYSPIILTNATLTSSPGWNASNGDVDKAYLKFGWSFTSNNGTNPAWDCTMRVWNGTWYNGTTGVFMRSGWHSLSVYITPSTNLTSMTLDGITVWNAPLGPACVSQWAGLHHVLWGLHYYPSPTGTWDRYMAFDQIEIYYAKPQIETTLNDMTNDQTHGFEGCGNWIFTKWKYYYFPLQVYHDVNASYIDTVLLSFNVSTREGWINNTFAYKTATGDWTLSFSPGNITVTPTRLEKGGFAYDAGMTTATVTFHIWFTEDCLDLYNVADCVDVYYKANDTLAYDSGWSESLNFFRIYNKGGFSDTLSIFNDAGAITGGFPLALWAHNDSSVWKDIVYRDLQHIKILPEVDCIVGYPQFIVSFGMDYCTGSGTWLSGLRVDITAVAITYGAERWINFTVVWTNRGVTVRSYDAVYLFHRGDAAASGAITYFQFWLDFWVDKTNSSTTMAGRFNAYEFPMKDNANAWLKWLSTNWGPKDDVAKESMVLVDLLDADGVTPLSSQKIKLVRFWSGLTVAGGTDDQQITLTNFLVTDLTFCNPPIIGIQTPAFDETKVPLMPQSGFIGVLSSTFSWWGKWLTDNVIWGGLSIWPALVAFLDTIGAWMGYPGAFSHFLTWIGGGWTWLSSGVTWLYSLIVAGWAFVTLWISKFITVVSAAFNIFGLFISGIFSFLNGTASGSVEVWNSLGMWQWLTLGLILYPVYLLILWDEHGLNAVEHELRRDWFVLSTVGGVFLQIGHFIIDIIHTLIESIPVAE